MSDRSFLSGPAWWRKALPWGLLTGVVVAGTLVLAEGPLSDRHTIDRTVLVDAAVVFAFVVVGTTALAARLRNGRVRNDGKHP
jgi:hypothetical protein